MLEANRSTTKDEAAKVLRKAGTPADQTREVLTELPDPFPVDHADPIFARLGVTIGGLIERMGGSPDGRRTGIQDPNGAVHFQA